MGFFFGGREGHLETKIMILLQNEEDLAGLLVLTIATKSYILLATVFLNLLLVIGKNDLSCVFLCNC